MYYELKLPFKTLVASLLYFLNSTFLSVCFPSEGTKIINQRSTQYEIICFIPEKRLSLKGEFKTEFDLEAKTLGAGKSKAKTL